MRVKLNEIMKKAVKILSSHYNISVLDAVKIDSVEGKFEFDAACKRAGIEKNFDVVLGFYDPSVNTIILNLSIHDNYIELGQTLLHELVHAIKYLLGHDDWAEEDEPRQLEVLF
jgi:hypothetical protein